MGCSGCRPEDKESQRFTDICRDYKQLSHDYTGTGIHRTKAWIGTISKSQLAQYREIFWQTRTGGQSLIWQKLRKAVESENKAAEIILESAGIMVERGNLQYTRDLDRVRYEIPIYVINDPLRFADEIVGEVKLEEMVVKVRSSGREDIKVSVLKSDTLNELKSKIGVEKARFFFSGKELLTYRTFAYYKINHEMVIHMTQTK